MPDPVLDSVLDPVSCGSESENDACLTPAGSSRGVEGSRGAEEDELTGGNGAPQIPSLCTPLGYPESLIL